MHYRNVHRLGYDFEKLSAGTPDLVRFVHINKHGVKTIDFSDPKAVKILNKALLNYFYKIDYWNIPENYLCPPVPGRAEYIHHLADLLAGNNQDILPEGNVINALDIGVGANCIYPIIGVVEYGWKFVGSDIDPVAIQSAQQIVSKNVILNNKIECRSQTNSSAIFKGIIRDEELFDITLCNPPFHSSLEEASLGTNRKWKNLGIKKSNNSLLNFGGQGAELWTEGGERSFLYNMVKESEVFKSNCLWFTTLVSKKETLPGVYKSLGKVGAHEVRTINMSLGQKVSRIVAWTFKDKIQQKAWRDQRWNS